MNTLPPDCLEPATPLVGITLIQGPDFQWPTSNLSSITSCPAFSFAKAFDAIPTAAQLHPPLRSTTLRKHSSLPPRKHLRDSNETRRWHEPAGIVKADWYRKHVRELPSVVVCPVSFDPFLTDEEQWEGLEASVQTVYGQARSQLNGRHCRVVLLCVCARDYSMDQESKDRMHMATERITSLRKKIGVEKSQVQLIYTSDMTPTSSTMGKIYKTLHGYASDYYKVSSKLTRDHKRGVDSRSGLSFCAQLVYAVRHNLKTAVFYEFRGTPVKSLRHLEVCFSKLVDLARVYANDSIATGIATGITIEELKSVAAIVNYTICRLHINMQKGHDAVLQFKKCLAAFRHLKSIVPSMPPLQAKSAMLDHPITTLYQVECWQWLANQHEIFNALLTHAQMNNLPLVPPVKNSKKSSKKVVKIEPLLTQYTHLSNAVLAYRRSHCLLTNMKTSVALWGGVALSIEEQARIQPSQYFGGMFMYDNVAPSVCVSLGEPQDHGFEEIHRYMMHAKVTRENSNTSIHNSPEEHNLPTTHYLQLIKKCLGVMRQELQLLNDTRHSRRAQTMNLVMSEFLIQVDRYKDALVVLLPAIHMFGTEKWSILLTRALLLAKYCSTKLNDPKNVILYGLQLIGSTSCVSKTTIQQELFHPVEQHSTVSSSSSSSAPITLDTLSASATASATAATYLTHDMSSSEISLINVDVIFQRNVVQIKDSVNVQLTLTSNFPQSIELNYIVLQLDDQSQLHRRSSLSNAASGTGNSSDGGGSSLSLSYLCVVVKQGHYDKESLQVLLNRTCGKGGRRPDIIIERRNIVIDPSQSISFLMDLMMDVPLPTTSAERRTMPKHGTVIFPAFVTTGIACLDTDYNVDLNIDLEHCRLSYTADALSRVDAYATDDKRMFSLLRPALLRPALGGRKNSKSSSSGAASKESSSATTNQGDFGSFRFTRLIPPLSSIDIQVQQHPSAIAFNDWSPVEIHIAMIDSIDSAKDLELTLWLCADDDGSGGGLGGGGGGGGGGGSDGTNEIQIMDKKTNTYSLYDPQSNPVLQLGSLSSNQPIVVSTCIRFSKQGLPPPTTTKKKYKLNVSIFHKTSRGWPTTKHVEAPMQVQAPFSLVTSALPTTKMTGHISIPSQKANIVVGEELLISSLLTNQMKKSVQIHRITYTPTYDMNAGTMSELVLGEEKTEQKEAQSTITADLAAVVVKESEQFTKCFVVRPLLTTVGNPATTTTSLGAVCVQWSTPSVDKPGSLVHNKTTVQLAPMTIADVEPVTAYVDAPKKCHLGQAFNMTLVVCNRSRTVVPLHFQLELGTDFYCSGRTNGNSTIQPLSVIKMQFLLIGVSSGNIFLPNVKAERTDFSNDEILIDTKNTTNQIYCFP